MAKDSKRHCWECLRRSLVCDFTQPECRRCSASGVDCPGYGETKPLRLRWVPTGKVKWRNQRQKGNHNDRTTRVPTESSTSAEVVTIPRLEPQTDIHAMIQAVEYYNTCMYPDFRSTHEIGPASFVYEITPTLFHKGVSRPDYIRLGIVCTTLSHRINRTRNDLDSSTLCALEKNLLHYRGLIIRSLSDDINTENKCTQDVVLAGILTLLLADSQQGSLLHWRWHLEGLRKLILLRGGIRSLGKSEGVRALLLSFAFIAIIGDTTSPASEMLMTTPQLEDLEFILDQYGNTDFAFGMFPTPLFAEIIKINHLRARAAKFCSIETESFAHEAYETLSRINSFSPEKWARSKPFSENDWQLLGSVYQAAVVLYFIRSLQSLSVLPMTPFLLRSCITHSQLLYGFLCKTLLYPKFKTYLFWPLVVLGMEAANGDEAMRAFVQEQLAELSRWIGTYVPLAAKKVLEEFWASGKMHWDDCFDKPYGFVTSLAMDKSRLS